MADRILPAASLVWSYRFRDLYDTPKDRSSRRLKIEYQIRAIVLPQQINFSKGENEEQTLWLEVIQNMLAESFTLPFKNRQPSSKTFKALRRALFGSEFLNRPVSGYGLKRESSPSDLFCAVQLVSRSGVSKWIYRLKQSLIEYSALLI